MKTLILNSDLTIAKDKKNQISFMLSQNLTSKKLIKLKIKFAKEILSFKKS